VDIFRRKTQNLNQTSTILHISTERCDPPINQFLASAADITVASLTVSVMQHFKDNDVHYTNTYTTKNSCFISAILTIHGKKNKNMCFNRNHEHGPLQKWQAPQRNASPPIISSSLFLDQSDAQHRDEPTHLSS
jgi:hypothetical protein